MLKRLVASLVCGLCLTATTIIASAQSGLRESLERLDTDQDGRLEPDEITPLARPFLERIARSRRLDLNRSNDIEDWQEAARIYFALANGVGDRRIDYKADGPIQGFEPDDDAELIPEFGLPFVKYPYTKDDLEEAERTLRRSDWNRDGFIDQREAEYARWTHLEPFALDLDGNGRLSRLELAQRYARRRLLEDASGELIKKAMRTGNGIRPSRDEGRDNNNDDRRRWRSGGSRYYLAYSVLSRFDRDRDGRIQLSEAAELGMPFGRIDIDRDGELSTTELRDYLADQQDAMGDIAAGLPAWFYELDVNRDGQVAMAEYATDWTDEQMRTFAKIDVNEDGLLVPDEVTASKALIGGSFDNTKAEILPPQKTIISEIIIDDDFTIADLNVQLSITHSHVGYLDAYLVGPDEERIELFTEIGGGGDNFQDTRFDDQAETPIVKARPPYEGSFLAEGLTSKRPGLGHYRDKSAKGVWQLVIRGTRSDRFGMLHHWALEFETKEDMLEKQADQRRSLRSEAATAENSSPDEDDSSPDDRSSVPER